MKEEAQIRARSNQTRRRGQEESERKKSRTNGRAGSKKRMGEIQNICEKGRILASDAKLHARPPPATKGLIDAMRMTDGRTSGYADRKGERTCLS